MDAWLRTFGKDNGSGKYGISTSTESLVVSILSAGTFFGALLAVSLPMIDYSPSTIIFAHHFLVLFARLGSHG